MTTPRKTIVGNTRQTFRDNFANTLIAQPSTDVWDVVNDATDPITGHIITQGGNSSGSSYLRISLSPFADSSEVSLTSKTGFNFPTRIGFGMSISQRVVGQEVFVGIVGSSGNPDAVEYNPAVPDVAITTATVTSNVATITAPNHGLRGGDRVAIYGFADGRMNVDPVTVTIVDANNFTVPCTITNGTYTAGTPMVRFADPLRQARNGIGYLFENTTTTNASAVTRRNGAKFRSLNIGTATTSGAQTNTNPYTDAWNAGGVHELYCAIDEVDFRSLTPDSGSGVTGYTKYTQAIPDEDLTYKLRVRARNLIGMTKPVGRITAISKTGTTTATVTTDVPHGLNAASLVQIYGVRDQTNFGNLTTQTTVASIVSPTQFTVVMGSAVTASSLDGTVFDVQGSVGSTAFNAAVQSITRTNGVLLVALNGAGGIAAGNYGEFHQLHGLTGAAAAYEGAYKLLRINGTVLEYDATGQPDFGTITTGGTVIKRTDVRLHFARVIDYQRTAVEVLGGKGNQSDQNNAVPVTVAAMPTTAVTQSTGTTSSVWAAAGHGGLLQADVASAALTATTTTSAVTPGLTANFGTNAHTFNVIVTAVSGTSPTLDVGVEESVDNGTNWVRIYDFPRITANGAYSSPLIPAVSGTRYRYVQTVGGTTPSFTRAINRVIQTVTAPLTRQFVDRTINLNTLNSTTPVRDADGCNAFQLVVATSAGATTNPQLQLQGSDDAANWYNFGPILTAAPSTVAQIAVKDAAYPKYVRAIVTTAGVAASLTNATIRALAS